MKETASFNTVSITDPVVALMFARMSYNSVSKSDSTDGVLGEKDYALAKRLAGVPGGSGHDVFLTGINIIMSVNSNHAFWLQWGRYHHQQIISSSSKMHTITKGDISNSCNAYVSNTIIKQVNSLIDAYNKWKDGDEISYIANGTMITITDKKELFEAIVYNTPLGYNLTAGITTNYLQLKSMYSQRKNHKMSYWNTAFVEWIHTLPYSEFITGEYND